MITRIKSTIRINDLEKLYTDISSGEPIEVLLPLKFDLQDFSLTPQLIQVVASILKFNQNSQLILDIETEPSFDEAIHILRDPVVFVIVLYYWNKDILNNKGESIKKSFWLARDETILQMQQIKYGKGTKALSACFDHLPTKSGLLKSWYSSDDFVTTERDLDGYIDKTLAKAGSFSLAYMKKSMLPILNDLEGILYELIKNTDEHARTDEVGNTLNPNTRGVVCTFHRNFKESFEKNYSSHKGIKKYLANVGVKPDEQGHIMFLEVSVFDTGPGLVRRYGKIDTNTISLDREVELLKECLAKNCTSATGESKIKKGKGLDRVLHTLNKKGFLKIRSGRTCLFRDLVTQPYENVTNPNQIKIMDWFTDKENDITELNNTLGTVISMFYPIDAQPIQVEEKQQQITLF